MLNATSKGAGTERDYTAGSKAGGINCDGEPDTAHGAEMFDSAQILIDRTIPFPCFTSVFDSKMVKMVLRLNHMFLYVVHSVCMCYVCRYQQSCSSLTIA
jgi:hypothetical protein